MSKNLIAGRLILLAALLALIIPQDLYGQQLNTSYFMESSHMRTFMNPAFRPATGYISIPGLGSTGLSYSSNSIALNDLFYKKDGDFHTFYAKGDKDAEFMGKLSDRNRINSDFKVDILSTGWYNGSSYFSFGLAVKGNVGLSLPKNFFNLLLDEDQPVGTTYNIKDIKANATSYAEASLGIATPITNRLTIGGRAKFLVGLGNFNLHYENVDIENMGGYWKSQVTGKMNMSVKGLEPQYLENDMAKMYHTSYNFDKYGVSGYGLGFDLGFEYKILGNLSVSAAMVDMGFIKWNKNSTVSSVSSESKEFKGFDRSNTKVGTQLENIGMGVHDMAYWEDDGKADRVTRLNSTLNVGVHYDVLMGLLGVGLLSSTKLYQPETYTELTAAVVFTPIRFLSASVSYTCSNKTYNSFGAALYVKPIFFDLFVGSDFVLAKGSGNSYEKINSTNVYVGMSVPIGRRK